MTTKSAEISGWIGVVALLSAFILLTLGMINQTDPVYQGLNFIGAVGIIIDAAKSRNLQPLVINVVWASVALVALLNILAGLY